MRNCEKKTLFFLGLYSSPALLFLVTIFILFQLLNYSYLNSLVLPGFFPVLLSIPPGAGWGESESTAETAQSPLGVKPQYLSLLFDTITVHSFKSRAKRKFRIVIRLCIPKRFVCFPFPSLVLASPSLTLSVLASTLLQMKCLHRVCSHSHPNLSHWDHTAGTGLCRKGNTDYPRCLLNQFWLY